MMSTRRTSEPRPEPLPLDWHDEEEIERIVRERMAARFETESFHWRLRLVAIETCILGLLMLSVGILLGHPAMMVLRASLMVAGSCFATGVLLLGMSASAARLLSRLSKGASR